MQITFLLPLSHAIYNPVLVQFFTMISSFLQTNVGNFYLYFGRHSQNVNAWRLWKQPYVYESKIRSSQKLDK